MRAISVCAAALLLVGVPCASALDYTPKAMEVEVFSDGVTEIGFSVELDSSLVQVEVQLSGQPYEYMLVKNQDGLPLDSTVTEEGVMVDSIGSTRVDVFYMTSALTMKIGSVWALNMSTPVSTWVYLPEGAAIISLNEIPLEISTSQGQPKVLMPPGLISVSYLTSTIDSVSKAQEALEAAENAIASVEDSGVNVAEARTLMDQAWSLFGSARFSDAMAKAAEAAEAAEEAGLRANEASQAIESASSAVSQADSEGRTDGLELAETYVSQANDFYDSGEYAYAIQYAALGLNAANRAKQPFNMALVAVPVLLIVGAASYFLLKRREKGTPAEPEHYVIDLDTLFKENRGLRWEDQEAIKFISNSGGEVFANEIRDKLGIPRTSAWRLVRRLVGMGVLEERKVGGQSLVSVSRRYRK